MSRPKTQGRPPRIYDAVYGYVELDEIEFELVNTAIFQRLHWIKQLGPLHAVFPSAQHSRFSHTIGVLFIAKKMIDHLRKLNKRGSEHGYGFTGNEDRILKFAALLHDIGHVPLSHIGERVLAESVGEGHQADTEETGNGKTLDLFAADMTASRRNWRDLFPGPPEEALICSRTKLHERLSAEIVLHDKKIDAVLSQVPGWKRPNARRVAKKKIAETIVGMDLTSVPTMLLHSELDADRLDYLLRDSFFTGVGYGQIDLDYIISRLVIHRNGEADCGELCVEHKGLHTVEHYILGRFFLQIQVIFNRKVRLMDLLFEDVMGYMLQTECPNVSRLTSLQEFCECIRKAQVETDRSHLHRIYSYTDALVLTKMRQLHEHLDEKEKKGGANERELYINDCIKMIMDGKLADPVLPTCQRLVDWSLRKDERLVQTIRRQAKRIARKVAKECGVSERRIKTDLAQQDVMKYSRKEEAERESNREAVKILYRTPGGVDARKAAAESNATILGRLIDRRLLLFNCYYVESRNQKEAEVKRIREAIADAFKSFILRHFMPSGTQPLSGDPSVEEDPELI